MAIKYLSRANIVDLFVNLFPNKKTLDKLSESDDGNLLFDGQEIKGNGGNAASVSISTDADNAIEERTNGLYVEDLSPHLDEVVFSADGAHGFRYYNSKLQYLKGAVWTTIPTSATASNSITISPTTNNALVKYSNGYYVPAFLISKKDNNAIQKLSDGYYVPSLPVNNATLDDVSKAKEEVETQIDEQSKDFENKYNTLVAKIAEIAGNTTKQQTHVYSGINASLDSIVDISTLYNPTDSVILSLEFMIVNQSTSEYLTISILENEIETLNDTLEQSEVQRYRLPSIANIEIFIQGEYELYLYINYI